MHYQYGPTMVIFLQKNVWEPPLTGDTPFKIPSILLLVHYTSTILHVCIILLLVHYTSINVLYYMYVLYYY